MFAQRLKVLFAVGTDGEVSEPLEVGALSCDTVEQVKEKILASFRAKFGFSYGPPLRELSIGQDLSDIQAPLLPRLHFIVISFYQNTRKMALLYLCKRRTPARRSSGR